MAYLEMIEIFLMQLINGIIIGAIYSLMAVGLTITWTISKVPDFSQGSLYMVAAYTAFFATTLLNFPFFLSLIVAMALSSVLSASIEKLVYRTIRSKPVVPWMQTALIAAIGLLFLIENVAVFLWTPKAKIFPSPYLGIKLSIMGMPLSLQRLLVLICAVIIFAILSLFIYRTTTGKAIRATAQDIDAAKLMGINVEQIYSIIFALGGALTAAAGVLISPLYAVYPTMGTLPIVKSMVVVILAGLGSVPGAIIGGFTLGIVETLCAVYISAEFHHAYAFFILIIVLLLRPAGIFGKK